MLFVVGTEIDFDPGANGFYLHKPKANVWNSPPLI
jgi:hypothetical protein